MDSNAQKVSIEANRADLLRASDWLWKPWYAKLWWAAVPVYWIGAIASMEAPALRGLYESVLFAYFNIAFMPFTPLVVLGVGYAREWMGPIEWGGPLDDDWMGRRREAEASDPSNPASGVLYTSRQHRLWH